MKTCKCGKQIVFGKTTDGKNVPLDPSAPTYEIAFYDEKDNPVYKRSQALVSHFKTCPFANDFSGNKNQGSLSLETKGEHHE